MPPMKSYISQSKYWFLGLNLDKSVSPSNNISFLFACQLIYIKYLLFIVIHRGKMQILTISLASPPFFQNTGKVVDKRRFVV